MVKHKIQLPENPPQGLPSTETSATNPPKKVSSKTLGFPPNRWYFVVVLGGISRFPQNIFRMFKLLQMVEITQLRKRLRRNIQKRKCGKSRKLRKRKNEKSEKCDRCC